MRSEFDYITDMLKDFFEQKHIKDRLNVIDLMDITGWEVWFQIEFSYFLSIHESEPEWHRELSFSVDARKEKIKHHVKPDFLIRKKGWALEKYAALEVKLHRSPVSCVSNVLSDFDKVRKIKRSEIDLRSYWGLGICKEHDVVYIEDIIQEKAHDRDYHIRPSRRVVSIIDNTPFSYFII
ncbi:hypothetical protein [Photobacterium galatheae]|uniref:Uncharacterized protein n=1 Tax=Photobacterium galatheae TaxID=1654360 RepID=A0A066RWT2_9GAMM|nr:hypothetical protein [Photobacterium galatheae]KDM93561.1 hypothetical protein EA58_00300 [Photobacterium galatheae]MCM0151384.1 hypothetical protein [Photobacterium galatheae]